MYVAAGGMSHEPVTFGVSLHKGWPQAGVVQDPILGTATLRTLNLSTTCHIKVSCQCSIQQTSQSSSTSLLSCGPGSLCSKQYQYTNTLAMGN